MRDCTHLKLSLPANVTLLTALPSLSAGYFFFSAIISLSGNHAEHWKMAFLNSADSTSDCSQQKRRGEENSSEAFWVGQKPFVNVPLIRKIFIMCSFLKSWAACKCASQIDQNVCSPLRNPVLENLGIPLPNPNLPRWAGELRFLFPHSVFLCYFYIPHNMQVLVSHTSAPKHFQVLPNDSAWNILFFFPSCSEGDPHLQTLQSILTAQRLQISLGHHQAAALGMPHWK